jgi:hypothetical protein
MLRFLILVADILDSALKILFSEFGGGYEELYRRCIMPLKIKKVINSVALVRKRTVPTELPQLVGEISANFSGERVLGGQGNESSRTLISVF